MTRRSKKELRDRGKQRRTSAAQPRHRQSTSPPKRTTTSNQNRDQRHNGDSLTDHDTPTLQMARALWDRRQFDRSLELYEQAVTEEPNNLRALVNAARAFGGRYQLGKAETLVERLLARAGASSNPIVQFLAGETCQLIHRPDRARQCFERACALTGDLPEARLALAQAYERAHRLDEAHELIDSIQSHANRLPHIPLTHARILHRQGEPAQAEALLRRLCEAPDTPREARCQGWAELALMLDKRDACDDAIDAIEHCKQDQLTRDTAERKAAEHVFGRFARLAEELTQADFDRWHDEGEQYAATCSSSADATKFALLAGFPRSGTTLLEQILDSHDSVITSEERDVFASEIFPSIGRGHSHHAPVRDVLNSLDPARIKKTRANYQRIMEQLLGHPIGDRIHLDKNPALTLMLPAIARLFPDMRFIIALRDPRDVVLSCYLRYLPLNPVSVWFLTPQDTARRYALDMSGWLRYREMLRAPWIQVRYEDLVTNLEHEARRTLDFLGLPWNPDILNYRQHASQKIVQSPTYADVTKPIHAKAVGRWRRYEKLLAPVLETLEPFIKAFGYH